MGARHYKEIIAWQLGDEIRRRVFRWTARAPFCSDFKRKGQIEGAIDSVCHNIAEGFSGSHAEFARYLGIARRSLNEVCDAIHSAELKGYLTADDREEALRLTRRLYRAIAGLIAYLTSTPDPPKPPAPRRPPGRRK